MPSEKITRVKRRERLFLMAAIPADFPQKDTSYAKSFDINAFRLLYHRKNFKAI